MKNELILASQSPGKLKEKVDGIEVLIQK